MVRIEIQGEFSDRYDVAEILQCIVDIIKTEPKCVGGVFDDNDHNIIWDLIK